MSKGLKFLAAAVIFLFFAAEAQADISIETGVSRSRLAVGEQLTFDVIVSNAQGKIIMPKLSAIEGFSAYSQGHSQEISIINGVSSSRSIYSFVLVANSVGTKTIGPFEININGKNFSVAPVQVEVTPPTTAQPQPAYATAQGPVNAPPQRALPTGNVSDQDIFCKAWLDKDEVFVNEPAMLTYTLYTRLSATYKGFDKEPSTTGFWVEDFPPEKTIKRTEQMLNGSRYVVADVRKLALFPTQAGVFTVDPGQLAATVEVADEDSFNSFYSYNIFGYRRMPLPSAMMTQTVAKLIPTVPVTITAKALPENGRPANFTGAVGSYEISSTVDKKEVEVGNPVTFRVRIHGQGNINTIQTPGLTKGDDFKFYDSSSSTNISKEHLIVEGEKVTETVIVPRKPGTFVLPELSFSYFDTVKKDYQTIKTAPVTLKVLPSTETEPPPPVSGNGVAAAEKEQVEIVAKDIRFIKTADHAPIMGLPLYQRPRYWFLNLLFLIGLAVTTFFASVRQQGLIDLKHLRLFGPAAAARKRLSAAEGFSKRQKHQEFYETASKAVYQYFAEKLSIPIQAVSPEEVERLVPELNPELYNLVKQLFDELSLGRFSTLEQDQGAMQKVCQTALKVIAGFEKVKRK